MVRCRLGKASFERSSTSICQYEKADGLPVDGKALLAWGGGDSFDREVKIFHEDSQLRREVMCAEYRPDTTTCSGGVKAGQCIFLKLVTSFLINRSASLTYVQSETVDFTS